MRFTAPILTLLALLSPHPAVADWEYTKWGMTPEQVVHASNGAVLQNKARSAGEGSGLEIRADGEFVAGSLRFDVSFGFDGAGRLAFVSYVQGDPARNGLFKAWLIRKYGEPQSRQNANGNFETWTWNRKGLDTIEFEIAPGASGFVIQSPGGD